MAYERQNWVDGTTICNAERMNHIENGIADLYNAIFPVGQIVIKGDNEDYSNWLGFTWERTAVGKVLVGIDSNDTDFNNIGKTGGEKTHTLSVPEMPRHAHYITSNLTNNPPGGIDRTIMYGAPASVEPTNYSSESTGNNQPHNNLQPYQVVAYWRRIA